MGDLKLSPEVPLRHEPVCRICLSSPPDGRSGPSWTGIVGLDASAVQSARDKSEEIVTKFSNHIIRINSTTQFLGLGRRSNSGLILFTHRGTVVHGS
jgi:hypothetical protein